MALVKRLASTVIFGFDSAWTDAPKAPGAICAIGFDALGNVTFHEPRLASFDAALAFVGKLGSAYAFSLVAIDQPTIVRNNSGCRPVERVAAALVSYVGGGVQPANRTRTGMFCDNAPIWGFLSRLAATEAPLDARDAATGNYLVEVFPALALPALSEAFSRRLGAPKYNPANRKKYRYEDWQAVADVIESLARSFGVRDLADWAKRMSNHHRPTKSDQDMLDSALCALIGLIWRAGANDGAVMLGDLTTGYIVTPVSDATRPRLEQAALKHGVPIIPVQ